MKITKVHNIQFDTEESIITSALSAPNELVLLLSSGDVIRHNIEKQKGEYLFSVKSSFTHEDGGFDINAQSTIYTLDSLVVIVNDYKRHGFVHYPKKYNKLHLWRQDYHADISCFPIALFNNEQGVPHLIYSEAWNHLQIMNLDTRQILTASKSLIEENAEERHLEFYKTYKEENKLPWPRPYDYFFGKLEMSPDNKNFLSAGWAWGSYDSYNVYDLNRFIESNRISDISIGTWEHSNRAACWIDNQTIAVGYNPVEEGDEGATNESPQEVHFYSIENNIATFKSKVSVKGLDVVNSKFQFVADLDSIFLTSDQHGVCLISLEGQILLKHDGLNTDGYYSNFNQLVKTDGKSVDIYKIET